jgi:hypothetical protein
VLEVIAAGDEREAATVRGDLHLVEGHLAQGSVHVAEARSVKARRDGEEQGNGEDGSHGIFPFQALTNVPRWVSLRTPGKARALP